MIVIKGISDFRLRHIFECGQCFRWEKEDDGSYTACIGDQTVNIKEVPCKRHRQISESAADSVAGYAAHPDFDPVDLYFDSNTNIEEERLSDYFDLKRDYGAIKKELMRKDGSEHMKRALEYGHGMRLLIQDPWETVISFIISQNNNITRIKKCIESLCENFGPPTGEYKGRMRYGFPEPEVLAALSERDLFECRLGYRDSYIIKTARKIACDGKERLLKAGSEDTRAAEEYLLSLPGIGPKVANCITLFAFQKYDSFPIDVWVRKVMTSLYGLDEKNIAAMSDFALEKFGPFSGFAQQYLFYYMRNR